jgi:hypothetical protein
MKALPTVAQNLLLGGATDTRLAGPTHRYLKIESELARESYG